MKYKFVIIQGLLMRTLEGYWGRVTIELTIDCSLFVELLNNSDELLAEQCLDDSPPEDRVSALGHKAQVVLEFSGDQCLFELREALQCLLDFLSVLHH